MAEFGISGQACKGSEKMTEGSDLGRKALSGPYPACDRVSPCTTHTFFGEKQGPPRSQMAPSYILKWPKHLECWMETQICAASLSLFLDTHPFSTHWRVQSLI